MTGRCEDRRRPPAPSRPGGAGEIWRVAAPLIVGAASLSAMQFTDRMFLSWHSADALRAVVPAGILAFTLTCGFLALVGYGATCVAHYHGAGDRGGCARAAGHAVIVAALAWPAILALRPLGRALIRLGGHPPAVMALENVYLDLWMLGSLGPLLTQAFAGFFSGRGDTRTPMWAHLAGNALNIVLNYVWIFGRAGFPALGLRGAAYATVVAGLLPPAMLAARFFAPAIRGEFATAAAFRWDGRLLRRLLRFGLPAGGHMWLDLTSFAFFVFLAGRFGEAEQAAGNIALTVNALAFLPTIGLGHAAAIVVGQHLGRGDSASAERAGWTALAMAAGYMGLVGLSYVLFPSFYVSLFTDRGAGAVPHGEVFPIARWLLIMLAIWSTGDATDLALAGALKGAGDTRFVMVFSLAMAYGLFVGGELIIVGVLGGGVYAAWAWTCVYILAVAAGYLHRFRQGQWKRIDLLGRQPSTGLVPVAADTVAMP